MRIDQLQPGDHFRQSELGVTGELIKINACRARVRIDGSDKKRGFEAKGKWIEFMIPGGCDNWAPSVEVETLPADAFEESGIY